MIAQRGHQFLALFSVITVLTLLIDAARTSRTSCSPARSRVNGKWPSAGPSAPLSCA
jgi:hypothetical protein